jgi:hypothetical protein
LLACYVFSWGFREAFHFLPYRLDNGIDVLHSSPDYSFTVGYEAQTFFTSSSPSLLWAEDNVVQNLFCVLVCFGYLED